MSDLISRQAAIDAMNKRARDTFTLANWYQYYLGALHDVADDIKKLPSAHQERWIPVSERLPEIGEHYVSEPCIVYCSNGAYGFAELEENFFGQVGWNCERDDEYHEPLGEVIAWMPLPPSYKGDEDERN